MACLHEDPLLRSSMEVLKMCLSPRIECKHAEVVMMTELACVKPFSKRWMALCRPRPTSPIGYWVGRWAGGEGGVYRQRGSWPLDDLSPAARHAVSLCALFSSLRWLRFDQRHLPERVRSCWDTETPNDYWYLAQSQAHVNLFAGTWPWCVGWCGRVVIESSELSCVCGWACCYCPLGWRTTNPVCPASGR